VCVLGHVSGDFAAEMRSGAADSLKTHKRGLLAATPRRGDEDLGRRDGMRDLLVLRPLVGAMRTASELEEECEPMLMLRPLVGAMRT
jgi:hypothetical protein